MSTLRRLASLQDRDQLASIRLSEQAIDIHSIANSSTLVFCLLPMLRLLRLLRYQALWHLLIHLQYPNPRFRPRRPLAQHTQRSQTIAQSCLHILFKISQVLQPKHHIQDDDTNRHVLVVKVDAMYAILANQVSQIFATRLKTVTRDCMPVGIKLQ